MPWRTVEDGTYVLDSMTFYDVCPNTAAEERTTWVICGGSWQTVQELERVSADPDAGTVLERIGVAATLQSMAVTAAVGCWYASGAGPTQVNWSYNATPGRFELHIPVSPGVRVDSFSRR